MCDIPVIYVLTTEEALSFKPKKGYGAIYLYEVADRKYVGQTLRSIKMRHTEHMHGETYFDKHLRTHSFRIQLLALCVEDALDALEKQYIRNFNTMYPNGLNYEDGGNANKHLSDETKKKIGDMNRENHKDGRYQEKYKHHSQIMKDYHASGKHTSERKVVCLEKNIVFNNILEASEWAGVFRTRIDSVLKGKDGRTAGGYHWAYYEDWKEFGSEELIKRIESERSRGRKVVRVEDGKVYDSIKDASEDMGVSYWAINNVLRGKKQTCKGYHWKKYNG